MVFLTYTDLFLQLLLFRDVAVAQCVVVVCDEAVWVISLPLCPTWFDVHVDAIPLHPAVMLQLAVAR